MSDDGGERLIDFLVRVSQDLNLLDIWRHDGPEGVLRAGGMDLAPEKFDVLRKGDLEEIRRALEAEAEEQDISAHQHGIVGPCWVLVRV